MTQREFKKKYKNLIRKIKQFNKQTHANLKELSNDANDLLQDYRTVDTRTPFVNALSKIKNGTYKTPFIFECYDHLKCVESISHDDYYFKAIPTK